MINTGGMATCRTGAVDLWHVVIKDKSLGLLPDDLDPGLFRPAYVMDVRPGDLVVGHFEGSARRRWAWTAAPGEVCYRALPQHHPLYHSVVSLDGINFGLDVHDEVLIVPAALYPAVYKPGDRVERIAVHVEGDEYGDPWHWEQRGTVGAVDDADGSLTVQWDGQTGAARTERDLVRPVDPDSIAHDRCLYGFTAGDRVCVRGEESTTGVLLEIYWPGHGQPRGRVLWDASGPDDAPTEAERSVMELMRAPVEVIAELLALPQG